MTRAVGIAAGLLGDRARRDVPIGPMTTYRVGGAAALFAVAETEADLAAISSAVSAAGVRVLVVGNGSHPAGADAGFAGLAHVLGASFGTLAVEGHTAGVRAATPPPRRGNC